MKKVALIADCWRKLINFAWITGSRKYIADHDLDVNLYVFNSFGNFNKDEKYNLGEYNIYNLPDFSQFDGIIMDLTNIEMDDMKADIIAKIREANVPAVSLADPIEGMYVSSIDDYNTMRRMVEHIVDVHGCKKVNFVGGPARNNEASLRLKAYKDVLQERGLECTEDQIYCGNYEMYTGEQAVRYTLERGPLPEAFVCVNDNLAVGVCQEAKLHGYECPRDFLVTGFDNFDKAACYSPRITTVNFVREEIAYQAMKLLTQVWDGTAESNAVYVDTPLIFQDSCGCVNPNPMDRGEYVVNHIKTEQWGNNLEDEMLEFKRMLVNCTSFQELAEAIPKKLKYVQCDQLHLIVDNEILELVDTVGEMEEEQVFRTEGYPECMTLLLSCDSKKGIINQELKIGELFPGEADEPNGNMFLFTPLHFRDREVGYLVFKNCDFLFDTQQLFDFATIIQENMESIYGKLKLKRMNEELSMLYIRDSLTGLYNRMAYSRLAVPLFKKCREKKKELIVMFVDVDRLKYINDTFGHDAGNIAITSVASSIEQTCPKDAIIMRYGGDEFVVLIPNCGKEVAIRLSARLRQLIKMRSQSMNMGFEINASIGYAMDSEKFDSLNDVINEADEVMYEDKKARHMARTN